MSEIEETQPKQTQPIEARGRRSGAEKPPRRPARLSGVLVFVLLIVLGVATGYGVGIIRRLGAQKAETAAQVESQYQLGLQAMEAGQYEVALLHFEYVINADPSYPGVMDAYTRLQLLMSVSPTPVASPTPAYSPTPDLRGAEEIYNRILQLIAAGPQTVQDWTIVIENLDSLRKNSPDFRTAEVDGMYYMALRERGLKKIMAPTCPEVNFEGGIYDLTLAERFGPLDAEAASLRTFARMFINGSSYWDQDWSEAQNFFYQAMMLYPDLRDASCKSARDRWRHATLQRAIILSQTGQDCAAQEQFDLAYSVPSDENVQTYDLATLVYNICHPATAVPTFSHTWTGYNTETPTPTP